MKTTIYLIFIFISIKCISQVGINTSNPQGIFHIDAGKDNSATGVPTSMQSLNDILVDSSGNLGVGTVSPVRKLHVNANNQSIKFEALPFLPVNTGSNSLVVDNNGDVYKNNTISVEGQILRIGLNSSTYVAGVEGALRFNSNDSAAEMGNAPNGAPNFINTIVGATITDNVSAPAGLGSPARTTDRITLSPGIYKIQVRLVATVASGSPATFIKCIVNNNEYSLVNSSSGSSSPSVHYYDDYINITGGAQTIDFSILPLASNLTISSSGSPGSGNSYRSLVLIQRLR
ncbi:hypothetical protein [Chryseobacterium sp. AG363]|uniref:hypothetical protein n=1 Tax=Chryseobacterium sp. AG363 TaxID=2183997 RepID=UPI000E76CE84|nr:hypothetical protein [Chryseobacterium sp. AG363]RKE77172.1 hypothetical protein DEU39_3935 [Chryseobacterium sp. AG363]